MESLINKTKSPDDIIRSLCIREKDNVFQNFAYYKSVVNDVFMDLNLHTIKFTKRVLLSRDKDKNSIVYPEDLLLVSSLSYLDECMKMRPMYVNNDIPGDIIDMSLDKDCGCECGCKGELCNAARNYEAITEVTQELMPDGSTKEFTSVTRKRLDKDGTYYEESTFPVRQYDKSGTWLDTALETKTQVLCKVEVRKCGCIVQSESNKKKLNDCAQATSFFIDCGTTDCELDSQRDAATYNYEENGRTVFFDSRFRFNKLVLRYYPDIKGKDIRVPKVAEPAFMMGLKSETAKYNPNEGLKIGERWDELYEREKSKLFTLLSRLTINEFNAIVNPKREMP